MFESFIGVDFWTALFVLLNTIALFLVMKKYLFLPVKAMIDRRQQEIDEMYEKAEQAQERANLLQNAYEEKLSVAQETGERLVKEAMVRGQNREAEILQNADRKAAAILEKASEDAAREKKKAITEAKNEISDMALEIAEKVVEKSLNAQDQQALVDRFIAELGEQV